MHLLLYLKERPTLRTINRSNEHKLEANYEAHVSDIYSYAYMEAGLFARGCAAPLATAGIRSTKASSHIS